MARNRPQLDNVVFETIEQNEAEIERILDADVLF